MNLSTLDEKIPSEWIIPSPIHEHYLYITLLWNLRKVLNIHDKKKKMALEVRMLFLHITEHTTITGLQFKITFKNLLFYYIEG